MKTDHFWLDGLPVPPPAGPQQLCLVLDEVDEDVGGAAEGGEEVGGVGDILHPDWPVQLHLLQPCLSYLPHIGDPFHTVAGDEYWRENE